MRGRKTPPAFPRKVGGTHASCSDQRSRLRRVRRLRAPIELHEPSAGPDRIRPEDADPPIVLQQRLLLRARRLPVIYNGDPKTWHGTSKKERATTAAGAGSRTAREGRGW